MMPASRRCCHQADDGPPGFWRWNHNLLSLMNLSAFSLMSSSAPRGGRPPPPLMLGLEIRLWNSILFTFCTGTSPTPAGFLPQRFISVFLLNKLLLVVRCSSGLFLGLLAFVVLRWVMMQFGNRYGLRLYRRQQAQPAILYYWVGWCDSQLHSSWTTTHVFLSLSGHLDLIASDKLRASVPHIHHHACLRQWWV